MKTVSYTPSMHGDLLEYMKRVFPYRSMNYLNWWLEQIDVSGKDTWDKNLVVVDDRKIVGCTTAFNFQVFINGDICPFFALGNTIVSKEYRGKGLSRQLYNIRNTFRNQMSLGVTDIAWKILPKYVKDFTPIAPVRVYISVSWKGFFFRQIWRMLCRKNLEECQFPNRVKLNRHEELIYIEDIGNLEIPIDGRWTKDEIEMIRDRSFFQKRYVDIYCHGRYHIYKYLKDGKEIGYIILRNTVYKGLDMLSLVDFRFKRRDDEIKAMAAAAKVAGRCGIGFVIALTSRLWNFKLSPVVIRMNKELHCAVRMIEYVDKFNDMLITSADSDLDFVYYK